VTQERYWARVTAKLHCRGLGFAIRAGWCDSLNAVQAIAGTLVPRVATLVRWTAVVTWLALIAAEIQGLLMPTRLGRPFSFCTLQ
jgi:hypothetical protein